MLLKQRFTNVRLEVLTAVGMKRTIFREVSPCNLVEE
jgi:hypothetical protein